MANFKNTKHKIRVTFEKIQQDQELLKQKENDLEKIFLSKNYIKHNNIVDDTEDQLISLDLDSRYHHTVKGTLIPMQLAINYSESIPLPRTLLPFLEFETRFKTQPDRTFASLPVFYSDNINSDYYRVTGDGDLIWQGVLPLTDKFQKIHQWQIDAGQVQSSHTQEGWNVNVVWTQNDPFPNTYRILNGQLLGFTSAAYNTSVGCGGNTNQTILGGSMEASINGGVIGKFNSISGDNVNVTGTEFVTTWTNPGTGCASNTVINLNVTKTFDIHDLTLFVYGQRQKLVGINWVNNPSGNTVQSTGAITSFDASSSDDFYLYYDTTLRYMFFISQTLNIGTGLFEPGFGNLPSTIILSPLPYSVLELRVNPDPYPDKLSERIVSDGDGGTTTYGEVPMLNADNTYRPVYFKTSNSTDVSENYNVYFRYSGNVIAPALIATDSSYYDWDDFYTISGTSYVRTSFTHNTKTRTLYKPSQDDMWYRVRTTIKNPFYWKETKKFDKEES